MHGSGMEKAGIPWLPAARGFRLLEGGRTSQKNSGEQVVFGLVKAGKGESRE